MRSRKLIVFLAVTSLAVLAATSFAQTTKLKRIGLYTFVEVKGQVPTAEAMKALFERYAEDIKTGFELAGNPELYEPFMDQIKDAPFIETTMPVGDVLPWMLFKSDDKVKVARNVEWAGKEPLPVFVVKIKKDWKVYDFVIPKGCGNIALSRNVADVIPPAVCGIAVVPERANVNDPITVDMSGTQYARSMSVEVVDAQGQKVASQSLTPQSPKWQTKFDRPGEYTFKGSAVNMAGIAATGPCVAKVSINFPPICKLWTSCLPCEDYVGRPITFDASGSSDPDGEIAKVVFELLDAQGNVIDTCVTTRKPWMWEKVFSKPGTFTINVTVFDNDGAQSPASDPCRLTFEVTQKKFFWLAGGGAGIYRGSTAFYGFLRAGMFYLITPDKWSFTLSAGGGIPFNGDPWRFVFTAEGLIIGHFGDFYLGTGPGFSTATQPTDALHEAGLDIVAQAGVVLIDKWTSKGSLFFEFRAPMFRNFDANYKTGLGFQFIF
jgi:hypothetical protein